MSPPRPSPSPPTAATGLRPAHASSWRATLHDLRQGIWRQVWVVGLICLGIAIFLSVLGGIDFLPNLVYSLCIGAICNATVIATRLAWAALLDHLRRRRGLPLTPSEIDTGWPGALPGALLAVLVGPSAGLWLGDRITGLRSPSLLQLGSTSTQATLLFSLAATVIAIVVISTLERLASARERAEAAQRQAAETQLRLLQSQLEPHMLFNTLANLRVLIGLDPARAQAMLDRLIAFLRATLAASRADAHPLATEFERVDDYLALMAVRMGARLQVGLDLPAELRTVSVPPLLLQPLVENAVKHGLEPKVEGGRIEVAARRDGDRLRLTVRDTGVGLAQAAAGTPGGPDAGTGFGLEQVRRRLQTLYGAAAWATLQAAGDAQGGATAVLELPLQARPTP